MLLLKTRWEPVERGKSGQRHRVPGYGDVGESNGEALRWINSDHIYKEATATTTPVYDALEKGLSNRAVNLNPTGTGKWCSLWDRLEDLWTSGQSEQHFAATQSLHGGEVRVITCHAMVALECSLLIGQFTRETTPSTLDFKKRQNVESITSRFKAGCGKRLLAASFLVVDEKQVLCASRATAF